VLQDIIKTVYGAGKGNLEDKNRIGSVLHNLGVVNGILNVEAIRIAQAHFGNRALNGQEVQWGFEHLDIDEKRIAELGAAGLLQSIHVTCADHEGKGAVKFEQWDGKKWTVVSDWINPDRELLWPIIRQGSEQYAKEHNITPRDCSENPS
jgi:branched-chain amino acid transport system substrate-binding protein